MGSASAKGVDILKHLVDISIEECLNQFLKSISALQGENTHQVHSLEVDIP